MSHILPPLDHPARAMFDVADVVAIGTRERAPVDLPRAKAEARRTFAANPAARRLFYLVLRTDNDALELVSVGPRGGHRTEWRFGPCWPARGSGSLTS